MISIIVAISENNAIGKDNQLLWHLPLDLAYFKRITSGHPIIMGRKTFESIGRALPNRTNIVISRNKDLKIDGVHVVESIEQGVQLAGDAECFIIGGGNIYDQAFTLADRIYLTKVHAHIEGDTFFPEIDTKDWKEIFHENHDADEKHRYSFSFITYDRK